MSWICLPVLGKNPIKVYSSVSLGICDKKVETAQEPGNDVTEILFFLNSSSNMHPGSHINGVPASETSAILLPLLISDRI